MKYKITYKDQYGTIESVIENKFSEELDCLTNYALELELGDVLFKGDTFDGLELQNENKYDKEQLKRFSFNKIGVHGTNNIVKELTNYKFVLELPLKIVDKQTIATRAINGILTVALGSFSPKDYSVFQYEFTNDKSDYSVVGDSFEALFDNLKKAIKESHFIKNCYGCNYSDYSPYGRDSFGDMLCFKHAKEAYLKISGKGGLFQLMSNEKVIHVQETYLCNDFEFRKEKVGYRG